jgi:hypothetical protein
VQGCGCAAQLHHTTNMVGIVSPPPPPHHRHLHHQHDQEGSRVVPAGVGERPSLLSALFNCVQHDNAVVGGQATAPVVLPVQVISSVRNSCLQRMSRLCGGRGVLGMSSNWRIQRG